MQYNCCRVSPFDTKNKCINELSCGNSLSILGYLGERKFAQKMTDGLLTGLNQVLQLPCYLVTQPLPSRKKQENVALTLTLELLFCYLCSNKMVAQDHKDPNPVSCKSFIQL